MALRIAAIAKLTLNVLDNGDAAPCPFLWLSSVEPALALVLLGWMVHCSCLAYLKAFALDEQMFARLVIFMSRHNSKQSNGVEPFGGLLKSILHDFLSSDCDYLQLPGLLSKFKSIDHEKNISSCIAGVAALLGMFESCPVGG